MTIARKTGNAMRRTREDMNVSIRGLMVSVYKIDKVMCKIKDFNHISVDGWWPF